MRVKRMKVSLDQLCRTFWRSHGCYKLTGHDGPHVCDCGEPCRKTDNTY